MAGSSSTLSALRMLRATTTTTKRLIPSLTNHSTSSSVSEDELSHFSSLASSWWDPMGPSRILHLMNPLRHDFIATCLADSPPPPADPASLSSSSSPAADLHYLDIGCGGGIFAESLARTIPPSTSTSLSPTRAASVLAIDPSPALIRIARAHARSDPAVFALLQSGRFSYQNTTLEDLVAASASASDPPSIGLQQKADAAPAMPSRQFDMVTLFEVLEHIDPSTSSPLSFLTNCLRLLRPGGWLVGSTIARSLPSFVVNSVIAEAPWPVGVVPRGTHEWSKFVNPDEVRGWVEEGLMRGADGRLGARRAGVGALRGMRWVCAGVMYFPGVGWKMVDGSERWGNYFWGVKKGEDSG